MKKSTIFKLLFTAMVMFAATAFTSCVDDNSDEGIPYLQVTPDVLTYSTDGGIQTLEIKTNRAWSIEINADDKEFVRIDEAFLTGNGDASVPVKVFDSQVARRTEITVSLRNKYDKYDTKKVTILQGEFGPITLIYNETFGDTGATGSPYQFLDQYTDYVKTGEGAKDVDYAGSTGVSARQSGKLSAGYTDASGHTKAFFGTGGTLLINKIALKTDQTNLTLNFGGSYSKNNNGTYDNVFYKDKFHVYLSADGTTWSNELEYTIKQADDFWVYATVNFSLKNPVEMLYVKMVPDEASVFAIDDPRLTTSAGGQEVDLATGGVTVTTNAPTSVTETGATFSGAVSTVEGVTAVGFQYAVNAAPIDWTAATKVTADAVATSFTKAVTGLTTGTTYAVRAFATTADGDVVGTVTTFTPSADGGTYYHTTVGNTAVTSPYPLVSDYTGWNATGSGASTVTYTAEGTVSVRGSGLPNTVSGHNSVFFGTFASGTTSSAFMINKITVPSSQKNMQLSFSGTYSVKNGDVYDNAWKSDKFTVSLSSDGTNWKPITYTVNDGDQTTPFWVVATSNFTLKNGVSAIYIKFTSTVASAIRLDDIDLASSATGGQEVDLGSAGGPSVSTNPTSLSFTADADNTGKPLTVTFDNGGNPLLNVYASSNNAQFTPTVSSDGKTITVTAKANATDQAITGKISVYLATAVGATHAADATDITVTQAGKGAPSGAYYATTIGNQTVSSPYPLVSDYTGWNATGSGASTVTYTADGTISVRASGKASTGAYDGASGPNVVFFGTFASGATSNAFMINKITVPSAQTKMSLTFGGSYSKQSGGTYDNAWKNNLFVVSLSSDGTSWTPITYTKTAGDDTKDPFWVYNTADFTLKNGVSSIYVKFEAKEASVIRLDDVALAPSATGGQEVDLGGGSTTPSITLDPTSLSFTAAADNTGKTVAVTVANQGANILYAESSDNTQFPTTLNGTTVTVKAAANTTSSVKTATVKVYLATGPGMTHIAEQTVAISQAAQGTPSGEAIYHTTIGNQDVASSKPLVSNYTDWQATGSGIANVTYTADGTISVRSSGKASTGAYDGASGPNVVFFGTFASGATSNAFMINNIAVPSSQTKMSLTFGGSYSKQSGSSYDNAWKNNLFVVSLSSDGTSWTPITYTKTAGDDTTDPYWVFNTANFTLKSSVSALYVKFEAKEASVFRLDDVTLAASATGGQEVDLGGGGSLTPSITLNPTSLSFTAAADNTGKTVAVTVANQSANILYAESSDNTQFPTTLNGTTVTVKAAANTTSSVKTATVKVYLATGPGMTHIAEQSVAISQAAQGTPPAPGTTTIAFTSPDIATPAIPLPAAAGTTRTAYVIGGQTYYIFADAGQSGKYQFQDNSIYPPVVEPATGLYLKFGYVEVPAVAGKSLTSVTLTSTGGMGSGVEVGIYDTNGQAVVASESFTKAAPLTLGLDGATATAYRIQVTKGNAQLHKIELIYSNGGTPSTPNITGVNPASLTWAATAIDAKTIAVSGTDIDGKLTVSSSAAGASKFTFSATGTTVTVTPKSANAGSTDITETLTIAATGGNSTTVALTQSKPVAVAPSITAVNPTSLSWEAAETATKDVAVTVSNQNGAALSVNTADMAPFTASILGNTITVTAPTAGASEVVKTMIVSVAGGNSMNVSLTKKAQAGGGAPAAGTVLWGEDFASFGANSTTFTQLPLMSTYDYAGQTLYKNTDTVTYTWDDNNNVRATTSTGTNCTAGHLWFNKSTEGFFQTSAIKLYGATSLELSYAQGTSKSELVASYSTDGTTWTELGKSGPIVKQDYAFTVPSGTVSVYIKILHQVSNTANTRGDNFTLTVK